MTFAFRPARRALLGACAGAALAVAPAAAQQQRGAQAPPPPTSKKKFELFAIVDYAAAGLNVPAAYQIYVTNSGPMDGQAQNVGSGPGRVRRGTTTFFSQWFEVSLWATAAPGDWQANRGRVPSLANVAGGGAALSYNYHAQFPGVNHWYAQDGSLGFKHSGVRSTNDATCQNQPPLVAGIPLMARSDCPRTWGADGWQGRRPIPGTSFQQMFTADKAGFRFDFASVPVALQDTTRFLGDNRQVFGLIGDYSRDRLGRFGSVIPGKTGAPQDEGYPLGLEWQFDAFTYNSAPGVVFWQATVTNRSGDVYGTGIDYDSLYAGYMIRHARNNRTRVGFDVARGTVVFNEIGHTSNCDNLRNIPGAYAANTYFGDCTTAGFPNAGFAFGTSAVVFLKSPIGDLRYKLFSDPNSLFYFPTSSVADDTLTYNVGRMCGEECVQSRFTSPSRGFGTLAAREALALGGDQPASLDATAYWTLFHPANNAAYTTAPNGPRVDLANPRGGGGFNFNVPTNWRYESRPAGAPAAGQDTLFLDGCNPDPAINRCAGIWHDTLPGRSVNFTRGTTWLGAGPFRLPAGATTSFVMAFIIQPDSASIETSINNTIGLYQSFFVTQTPPPLPRVRSVRVTGGNIRQTGITVTLDNPLVGYVDPFLAQLATRYRTAAITTVEGRLQSVNRLGPLRRTISDTLDILSRNNITTIYVYKSCDNGRNWTRSTSPNLCTRDVIRDSLGVEGGPAAYTTVPATTFQYTDGNVLSGQTYWYVFSPATRGVRLQLIDSTGTGANIVRRALDTALVAALPATPPNQTVGVNTAVVYVPASQQAGSAGPRVVYTEEKGLGLSTLRGDSATFNGPTVVTADSLTAPQSFRAVFGNTVIVREYLTNAALDSTRVVVLRSAVTGFTFTRQTATDTLSVFAATQRGGLDSLVYVRHGPFRVPQVAVLAVKPDTLPLGAGKLQVSTTLRGLGGLVGSAATVTVLPQTVTPDTLPTGVLVLRENGDSIPLVVGNDFRASSFMTSSRAVSAADFPELFVDIRNRPVLRASGAQLLGSFWRTPRGDSIFGGTGAPGQLSDRPTMDWSSSQSRFIGTSFGEFVYTFAGPEWGPLAPFSLAGGNQALQAAVTSSLQRRAKADLTRNDPATISAINFALGTSYTADSLLVVNLPFKITHPSGGGREVIAAIRRSDKMISTPEEAASNPLAARYYKFGGGVSGGTVGFADTARVLIPIDQWVPNESLILLERVQVAARNANGTAQTQNGEIVLKDTLVVIATRAMINCAATFCNPVTGRGASGYSFARPNQPLVVRYGVPFTPEREVAFTVTPLMVGTRVGKVTAKQLDSVHVVPNPYILFSNFEQGTANEQRIMFTHLPPRGVIRIYTAAGVFVQQISWTPQQLFGSGDLYYNLLTREGTLLGSGLYVFTVEARGESGGVTRKKVGRFIIIR